MELLALLLLIAFIGVGAVLRAMFMAVVGLMALIGLVIWLLTTDFSNWHWWALGLLPLFVLGVRDEIRRRDSGGEAPRAERSKR